MKERFIYEECKKEFIPLFDFESIRFEKIDEGLSIKKHNNTIRVGYSKLSNVSRSLLILNAYYKDENIDIEERENFKEVGLMIDCARNGVSSVATICKLIRIASLCGYNRVMLYLEDVFKIEDEPAFGYLRGRYTREEMKSIDDYAERFGIEIVPFIQTLAHLKELKKWGQYADLFDCEDILLCGDDRVYALIEKQIKTLSECFRGREIHLGMDEAFLTGRGRYMDEHGYRPVSDVFAEHLNKVVEIAEKFNYKTMIWGDMFLHFSENAAGRKAKIIPTEKIGLVYWDYYSVDKKHYEETLKKYERFGNEIIFASGLWRFTGFVPNNAYSIKTNDAVMPILKEHNVERVFTCAWGDNGAETSVFAVLPSIMYFGLKTRDKTLNDIEKEFYAMTGVLFEDFMKLDYPDSAFTNEDCKPVTVAKNAFYSDIFSGYLDILFSQKRDVDFKGMATELEKMKKNRKYGYLFDCGSSLCKVLDVKYDLGIEIRKKYKSGDKVGLEESIEDISETIKRVKDFYIKFERKWKKENKPFGFEVQDIRFGGLIQRLSHCKTVLRKYVKGEIEAIPELEQKLFDGACMGMKIQDFCINNWGCCTANVLN